MKRTPKSINNKEFIKQYEELFRESKYQELWRFNYINRHIFESLYLQNRLEEVIEGTIYWIEEMLSKYCTKSDYPYDEWRLPQEFLNSLIYGYHKKTVTDGFLDLMYESHLLIYGNPIENLTLSELEKLKELHALTYKYGYLILTLYAKPDPTALWEIFIDETSKICRPQLLYPYPNKDFELKGIQISLPSYNHEIKNNWDLAIYFQDGDKLHHIRQDLKTLWDKEDQQIIGDSSKYDIALYIDRKSCTSKQSAINTLELQAGWLHFEQSGRIAIISKENNPVIFLERHKNPDKFLSNSIDSHKLSESLSEKRWNIDKNNIRRTIGLYLWDKINTPGPPEITRKSLIKDTIEQLRTEKPEILDHYRSGYNTPTPNNPSTILGDHAEVQNTVIREMEADYDLTDLCIQKAEYLSPQELRNANRK